jgi:hypothetical protein
MKKLIITALTLLLLVINLQTAYAQATNTTTTQTSEESLTDILNQIDDERIKNLELQLLLSLPLTSENPNHIVTFTDPSPSQKGVFLQVDGKEYKQITSPYTLPTLGIGLHVINFRFYDKVETQQILERNFVVIPRAPQIKPPVVNGGNVTLSGTSIAASQVEIIVFNDLDRINLTATSDPAGNWSINIEKQLVAAKYTVMAVVRKNGFASKFSETIGFEVGAVQIENAGSTIQATKPIYFRFDLLNQNNIIETISQNPDLGILMLLVFAVALFIAILVHGLFKDKESKKAEKLLKSIFLPKNGTNTVNNGNEKDKDNYKKQNVRQILQEKLTKKENPETGKPEVTASVVKTTTETATFNDKDGNSKVEVKEQILEQEVKLLKEEMDEIIKDKKEKVSKEVEATKITEKDSENMEDKLLPIEMEETVESKEEEKQKAVEEFKKEEETEADSDKFLSKEDFLMKFKDLDPDNEKGEENNKHQVSNIKHQNENINSKFQISKNEYHPNNKTNNKKKDKRNIKISLTSKD